MNRKKSLITPLGSVYNQHAQQIFELEDAKAFWPREHELKVPEGRLFLGVHLQVDQGKPDSGSNRQDLLSRKISTNPKRHKKSSVGRRLKSSKKHVPGTPKLRSLLKKTFESRFYDSSDVLRSGSAKKKRSASKGVLKSRDLAEFGLSGK